MKQVITIVRLVLLFILTAQVVSYAQPEADIARQFFMDNREGAGLSEIDIKQMQVNSATYSRLTRVDHVYFQQYIGDIPVFNAMLNAHLREGKMLMYQNQFSPGSAEVKRGEKPRVDQYDAVIRAAKYIGNRYENLDEISRQEDGRQRIEFAPDRNTGDIISVQLTYQPVKNEIRLAWEVEIRFADNTHWYHIRVDAGYGEVLDMNDWVVTCNWEVPHDHSKCLSEDGEHDHAPLFEALDDLTCPNGYLVYDYPVEAPHFGDETLVCDPADPTASPFGWHDTDGTAGAEFTTTQGNNVDARHAGTVRADGGPTLHFEEVYDTTTASAGDLAAIINLFYWNNITHDVWYHYGFDEVSGNFQENNYGHGGAGSDYVNANAQAPGNCNANMATPPDGSNPTMNMFLCSRNGKFRDGDLDNGVIVHEYTHGISNRLTGGPGNSSCLNNAEQMGEGWSDWYGLVMTIEPGDDGLDSRGIGTWLLGEEPNGPGVRVFPYSTDLGVNPDTYNEIFTTGSVHRTGSVWCAMLWEMTWALIDEYGFDPDIYFGTGGNNIAMALITEGMKLQPCQPGFVDGRDAILLADTMLNGGANACLIWEAFAKRGLGYSADQGSSGVRGDGVEAFDMPPTCLLSINPSNASLCAGDSVEVMVAPGDVYTADITISTSGEPAGVTTTISPLSVPPMGISTVKFVTSASTPSGIHDITINGYDGGTSIDAVFRLDVEGSSPSIPTLVSPADGSTNVILNGLDWADAAAADSYEFEMATDMNFTSIVFSDSGFVSSEYDVMASPLTTYYWRVKSYNVCDSSEWSDTFSFTTANVVCNTYDATGLPIPVPTTGTSGSATHVLNVLNQGQIIDINVVDLDMSHTWVGDLEVTLVSPMGSTVDLIFDPCGNFDNMLISFDDEAASPSFPCPPTDGLAYQPLQPLSGFDSELMAGNWTLSINDDAGGDAGTLNGWSLQICYVPCDVEVMCNIDADGDGFGDGTVTQAFCSFCPGGWSDNALDCDDANPAEYPGGVITAENVMDYSICIDGTVPGGAGLSATTILNTLHTYSSNPDIIIDDTSPQLLTDTIEVPDDFNILDANVDLKIDHTWIGDLTATIQNEAGMIVSLFDQPGIPPPGFGCSEDNIDVTFDDEAVQTDAQFDIDCIAQDPTKVGSFQPIGMLSAYDGNSTMGDWILTVQDLSDFDEGLIDDWSITFAVPTEITWWDAPVGGTLLHTGEVFDPTSIPVGSGGVDPGVVGSTTYWAQVEYTPLCATVERVPATFTVECCYEGTNPNYFIDYVRLAYPANNQVALVQSGPDVNGYGDYTVPEANIAAAYVPQIYFSTKPGNGRTMYMQVWIDWNKDGDFDASEMMAQRRTNNAWNGQISVPAMYRDVADSYTMRITASAMGYITNPCGSFPRSEAEDYTICINNGCAPVPLQDENDVLTDTKDVVINKDIKVIPNPFSETLLIDVQSSWKGNLSIQLVDQQGKVLINRNEQINDNARRIELTTDDIPAGIYYVRIQTNENVTVHKMIKVDY